MKQVAVFNRQITSYANGALEVSPEGVQSFALNKTPVTCGLLEMQDTFFNPHAEENLHKVLVRKKAFSCNYRDKAIVLRAKQHIDNFNAKKEAKFYTLGSEFVGEVVSIGRSVHNVEVGDHIIGNGNYPFSGYDKVAPGLPTNHGSKELEVFHFSKVIKVPKSMPLSVAASFPIGGQTAYSMIRKLQLQAGEKVLVTAATSNTSLFAINALKQLPVEVYAITTRQAFVPRLKELGVKEVFVIERGLQSLVQDANIKAFVQANGFFNAVIDPFFDIYLGQSIDVIALEGRYVTCGLYGQALVGDEETLKKLPKNLNKIMTMTMMKNIQIIGNCIGKTADLENAIKDYSNGQLDVVIDSIYQNGDVANFFERSFNAKDRFGKVVYQYSSTL